jgi:hypothetical protein
MPPALLAGGRQPFHIQADKSSAANGSSPEHAARRSSHVADTNISHELPWLQASLINAASS